MRTLNGTPTALRLLYHFKQDLHPSKGASGIGTASQRLTAECLNQPRQRRAQAGLHAPWLLMLASRARSRSRCSGVLPCYRAQLISLKHGTISMIDSLSPHLIGGLLELCIEAGERAHDGPESRGAHRTLTQIHGSSVRGPCRHVRRKNAAARRSVLPTSPRLRL